MRAHVLRRAVVAVCVPLALAVGVPVALGADTAPAARAASGTGWRAVATVNVRSADTALYSVAVAGSGRAWAVGNAFARRSNQIRPVIESWNGTAGSRVRLPAGLVPKLGGPALVTAAASRRIGLWAFTLLGGWLHRSGSTWTAGMLPHHRFVQASLTAGPAVWAFGGASVVPRGNVPFAAFHTGADGWTRTAVPGKGVIADASAVSGRDIWAVIGKGLFGAAASTPRTGTLVHWTGGRWRTVAGLPAALRNSGLGAVLARSDRDIWVGGAISNSAHGRTEAVGHWNGRRWTVTRLHAATTAAPFRVASMAPDGSGGIWAVGLCIGKNCPATSAAFAFRLWHETGDRWAGPVQAKLAGTRPALPLDLAAAGRSVWAAGVVLPGNGRTDGLIALWGPTPR